jgi:hypothetical protein
MIASLRRPKAHRSEFIFVIVIERLFLNQVQLHWVQTDDLELNSTLFAIHRLAFIYFEIDVDICIAFGTRSGRHFLNLQGRFRTSRVALVEFRALNYPINLTLASPILQY